MLPIMHKITYIKLLCYNSLQLILSYLIIKMALKKQKISITILTYRRGNSWLMSLNDSSKFLTKLSSHYSVWVPSNSGARMKSPSFLPFLPLTLPFSSTLPPSLHLQRLLQGPFLPRSLEFLPCSVLGALLLYFNLSFIIRTFPLTIKLNKCLLIFTKCNQHFLY